MKRKRKESVLYPEEQNRIDIIFTRALRLKDSTVSLLTLLHSFFLSNLINHNKLFHVLSFGPIRFYFGSPMCWIGHNQILFRFFHVLSWVNRFLSRFFHVLGWVESDFILRFTACKNCSSMTHQIVTSFTLAQISVTALQSLGE